MQRRGLFIYNEICRPHPGGFEPNADVCLSEDERTLIVTLEIAGAELNGLDVVLEGRELIVLGTREDGQRCERSAVLMKEIAYGSFLKRMHLPIAVRYDDAVASYRDGLLTIRLPVSEHASAPTGRAEVKISPQRNNV
jgi:HSP20 family protein